MKIADQISVALKSLALVLVKLLQTGKNYIILINIGHSKIKDIKYLKESQLENIYKYKESS
jgi:hypothetical protein